jgi:hypothetical protein
LRNDGFSSGLLAGVALGAVVMLAMAPQVRRPVMEGAGDMTDRMRRMWRKRDDMMENMLPGDPQ